MDDLQEMSWKSSSDDGWVLANWTPKQIRELYCDQVYWGKKALKWESIRQYRKSHREELKVWRGMEKPTPFENMDSERERVKRVRSTAPKVGDAALKLVNIQVPEEHAYYHEKLQEALEEKGVISKARFSAYQMLTKDNEGEAQIHDLKAEKFDVAFDYEPKWPVVQRVESKRLHKQESKKAPGDSKRAVILPDLQIPWHDEKAVEVALKILKDAKPDKVVVLGDLLDLAAFSRFEQRPEFAGTTQAAIVYAHQLLAEIRRLAPTAEIAVLEGNHDKRLEKSNLVNWGASHGIKRAVDYINNDGYPVMSVPHLLSLDTLDIEYVGGYPANRYWINDRLQVRHGQRVRSAGSTAKLVSDDERVSTIFGHVHRIETHFKTTQVRAGGRTSAAFSIGALCRIDGSVPSTKNGYDLSGKPVENYEDWQQAICIVDYEDGDNAFNVQPTYIDTFNNYRAVYNGRVYEAMQDV